MSILLISTCSEKLCEREFVNPIAEIVQSKSKQILHYTECTAKAVSTADKILICGTSWSHLHSSSENCETYFV